MQGNYRTSICPATDVCIGLCSFFTDAKKSAHKLFFSVLSSQLILIQPYSSFFSFSLCNRLVISKIQNQKF